MTLKIAFSVDDFAPAPGYGLYLTNGPLNHLKKLNDEFGCKFTMFAIPMMDGNEQYRWDNNPKFVSKVKELDWLEVAQHGMVHKAKKEEWGSNEFIGLSEEESRNHLVTGYQILSKAGVSVSGFKAPGWTLPPNGYKMLKSLGFVYVADHFFGNKVIDHNGLARVPLTFSIDRIYHDKYDDYLILHSHMNTSGGNRNAWTKELYTEVRDYLLGLQEKYDDIEFVTMSELVEEQLK